jgi:hypothetical protein
VISSSKVSFERYALPHLPLVALWAGLAIVTLGTWVANRVGGTAPARVAAWIVVIGASTGWLVGASAAQAVANAVPDSRVLAERWIAQNAPDASRWVTDSQGPKIADPYFEVNEGKALPFERIRKAAEQGQVRWVAVNGYTAVTMLDAEVAKRYPAEAASYRKLVEWLEAARGRVKVFPGRRAGGRGPELKLYQVNGARARKVSLLDAGAEDVSP